MLLDDSAENILNGRADLLQVLNADARQIAEMARQTFDRCALFLGDVA